MDRITRRMSPKRTGMHFLFCFVDLALIAPNIRWIRRFSAAAQHLIMVHFNLSPLCGGIEKINTQISDTIVSRLNANSKQHIITTINNVDSRNLSFFKEEEDRIYRWERDVIDGIEQELDIVKRNIRETERLARQAENIEERISLEAKAEDLRRQKRRKRNELENREDEISVRRKELVAELERKMIQTTSSDNLFIVRWSTN